MRICRQAFWSFLFSWYSPCKLATIILTWFLLFLFQECNYNVHLQAFWILSSLVVRSLYTKINPCLVESSYKYLDKISCFWFSGSNNNDLHLQAICSFIGSWDSTFKLKLTHIWLNLVTNILTGFPAFLFPGSNYDVQAICSFSTSWYRPF
jgi:hypothetical protein